MNTIPTESQQSTILDAFAVIVEMLHRTPAERLATWQAIEEWAMRNKQEAQVRASTMGKQ